MSDQPQTPTPVTQAPPAPHPDRLRAILAHLLRMVDDRRFSQLEREAHRDAVDHLEHLEEPLPAPAETDAAPPP